MDNKNIIEMFMASGGGFVMVIRESNRGQSSISFILALFILFFFYLWLKF